MCTSPLVRYRQKYPIPIDVPIELSYTHFKVISQKKIESRFKNFGSFLEFMDRYFDYQFIPCRKCDECKAKYAQDWSIRCYHEYVMSGIGSFITLTISESNDNALLETISKSYKNGTNYYCKRCKNGNRYFRYPINYSLNKHFILDWLKKFRDNLRYNTGITIRYFGCGEYGELDERPHYHILIFGYDFPDKAFYKTSPKGVSMYVSEELSKAWPYGISSIQDLNFRACMYTAKYCTKKLRFDDAQREYEYYYGRQPEFLFMSKGNCQSNRCPYISDIVKQKDLNSLRNLTNEYCKKCDKQRGGLGYSWLEYYLSDVLRLQYISIEGKKYSIPKYYLDIIKLTYPDLYAKYKLSCYLEREEKLNLNPLESSTARLSVKAKVKRGKVNFYQRKLC